MIHDQDGSTHHRLPRARFVLSVMGMMFLWLIAARAAWADETTKPIAAKKYFSLPVQDLVSGIVDFNRQSGIYLLYSHDGSESIRNIRTRSVVGEFTITEALTRMLEGTGFQYRIVLDDTIALYRVPQEQAPKLDGPAPARPREKVTPLTPTSFVKPIDEVLVTGSRLHGALDSGSPMVLVPKKELRKGGYATVHDALYTLPLKSLSGPREDWGGQGNANLGAGINLRNLGAGATLVLVDGHRQPVSGEDGSFTDVSNIPWSAVERIEIVPDGTSALYGSDAIAGVVNIIMRDDLDGAESQARLSAVPGGANETQVSQLFGKRWSSGHALFAYQYAERAPLAAADRAYAASADKRPLGGTDHRTYFSNPGNIIDPMTLQPILGIPPTGVQSASDFSTNINLASRFALLQLLPDRQAHSVFLTATQNLSDRWSIRADGRFTVRDVSRQGVPAQQTLVVPRSNPFFVDPFPGRPAANVIVAYSFMPDLGPIEFVTTTRDTTAGVSATGSLGHSWQLALSQSYGREAMRVSELNLQDPTKLAQALNQTDPATAFNPFGHTSPDVIRGIRRSVFESASSEIAATSAVADGTVGSLSSGAIKLAIGAEYRREAFDYVRFSRAANGFDRHVGSGFAEVSVPIVGSPDDARAAPRLEFSAASRFETYSDFGDTFNPRMGIKWAPLNAARVRASWGRSFRAPTLVDRDTSGNVSGIASLADPKSPTGRSVIVTMQGNNPDVRQETATTWTAGLDFVPIAAEGSKLSLTYFDVDYASRIVRPAESAPFEILLHEDQWASVINRHPTQAQIDAICQRPDFIGAATCAATHPSIIVDLRKMNLAETRVRGIDAEIERKWESGVGWLNLHLMGSYLFEFEERGSPAAPTVSVLDTVGNSPALRMRGEAEWSQHAEGQSGFTTGLAVNYMGAYRDLGSTLVSRVQAWMTADLQLKYRTSSDGGWRSGAEVSVNAVNVYNTPPPFVDREEGYDLANAQPIGRTISLEVRKSW